MVHSLKLGLSILGLGCIFEIGCYYTANYYPIDLLLVFGGVFLIVNIVFIVQLSDINRSIKRCAINKLIKDGNGGKGSLKKELNRLMKNDSLARSASNICFLTGILTPVFSLLLYVYIYNIKAGLLFS